MRVLVTGGAGYIGSVTAEALCQRGHSVWVFDNLETGHVEALPQSGELILGDLRHPSDIDGAIGMCRPDAVMHFAAYALVGESMQDPGRYFSNNTVGSLNLLGAMRAHGVPRLVFSSSCATYGEPSGPVLTERDPEKPTNPYGESKLMVERMIDWYGRVHGLEWVVLRYFNVCGATERLGEDHAVETHLVPLLLRVASGQAESAFVFGDDFPTPDGTAVRDYVHVADIADAHCLALEAPGRGAFNLGVGRGCSVMEVINAVRRVTRRPVGAVVRPRRPGDPACLVASAERARTVLGWEPRHTDLEQMVLSAWRWHRAHPEGYRGSAAPPRTPCPRPRAHRPSR